MRSSETDLQTGSSDLSLSEIQSAIDNKTKPLGALGEIETLAAQIANIQQTLTPQADTCRLTIFAADHGMALAGVSAFPQAVTRQMVLNFLTEGAAANVFARSVGAEIQVVDAGVCGDPIIDERLLQKRIGNGTANAIERPAMTPDQVRSALVSGSALGHDGNEAVACFGEMGIGNTSSSSLVAAKVLGLPVTEITGRGTGLDDDGLQRKSALLEIAATRTVAQLDAKAALQEYGGFEIAMMTGAMLGAAAAGKIVIVDGFIASAAALAASRIAPESRANMVFAHQSAEAGHARILDALEARPLLQLNMRLGEGTGALLAFPLVRAAADMLRDMASFESTGVSGPA
ncbi:MULTISPECIES: nicotinate-nucleotide--dimethylbenzimidazole phosphoribosyltransferase [Hyphomonas]|jgi:nicotinate-nucleotide--dimethylbenzimidazole phosphoribosyltransferase|uniref:nicotinate-nucleotide--dimethylbenzimidazole phosphoribosyltransferase n=1 Tax=Hyphomonas TaxID=85 RepID=UPI003511EEC4